MIRYATTEKVAVAWLSSLPDFSAAMVGTVLPAPPPAGGPVTWASTGFLVVTTLGGASELNFPLAHPRVSVQCWAVDPDTGLPPWNFAGDMAASIGAGCQSTQGVEQVLTLPNSDQNARLLSAYITSLPRRIYGDQGDYACMVTELALHWTTH